MAKKTTIREIKENLDLGFSYTTKATGMTNGGLHSWWFADGRMHVWGQGTNWRDQDDYSNHDLDSAARALYHDTTREGPFHEHP